MGIEAKVAYRSWLRGSFQWETVRLMALSIAKMRCFVCGKESLSNNAHHLRYREKWDDTKFYDLKILCEQCHCEIHKLTTPALYKTRPEAERAFHEAVKLLRERNAPLQPLPLPKPPPELTKRQKLVRELRDGYCTLCFCDPQGTATIAWKEFTFFPCDDCLRVFDTIPTDESGHLGHLFCYARKKMKKRFLL